MARLQDLTWKHFPPPDHFTQYSDWHLNRVDINGDNNVGWPWSPVSYKGRIGIIQEDYCKQWKDYLMQSGEYGESTNMKVFVYKSDDPATEAAAPGGIRNFKREVLKRNKALDEYHLKWHLYMSEDI